MNIPFGIVVMVLGLGLQMSSAQEILVRAGELIHCTLEEPNFSSATADVGEPVVCYLSAFREFGRSVFPRGSYLIGHLSDYRNPGHFVGKGWLQLTFDRLVLYRDLDLPVSTKVVAVRNFNVNAQGRVRGHGHPKRDAFYWSIPMLWPVQVMKLPARGPRPVLRGEVPVVLRVLDDIAVP